MHGAFPILSCEEAKAWEAAWFAGDEAREWAAMSAAGRAVARGIIEDFREIGPWPKRARVLVLVGKGHNAGDALIAATELRRVFPDTRVTVRFLLGERALRPLATRAWRELAETGAVEVAQRGEVIAGEAWDVVIDGVFGFQFRAPLAPAVAAELAGVNAATVRLRAAVDLPSGLGERDAFCADFSYATGIVKAPLLELANAGRARWLDLGFTGVCHQFGDKLWGLGRGVLDKLAGLRPARCDKRTFGHVLVVAGSRRYGGAALMATLAAQRGGAGLVTAAVPESLVAGFVARAPEAMWVGLPETPEGGLALEGLALVREAMGRATAVVLGPGIGTERETLMLAAEVVKLATVPVVIDADALRPEVVAAGAVPRVLTPHAGEWARIEGAVPAGAVVVRKGPITRIEVAGAADGGAKGEGRVYHSFFGGPVLARGGSGDVLAGLLGAVLASGPDDVFGAAARGVVWHGAAADALARERGARAVRTTELLDYLADALRT